MRLLCAVATFVFLAPSAWKDLSGFPNSSSFAHIQNLYFRVVGIVVMSAGALLNISDQTDKEPEREEHQE